MTSTLASIATTRVSPTRMRGAYRARLGFAVNPRRSVRTGHSVVPRTVASGSRKEINVDRLVKLDDSFSVANANSKHAPAPGAARYHVTFITGEKMGSGLSAPDAGVQLMLIAEDGRACLERVDRYPDVCGDKRFGNYSYPRFERGGVDEVVFDAPDIGAPCALYVAPEKGGSWFLVEVEVRVVTQTPTRFDAEGYSVPQKVVTSPTVSFPCFEKLWDAVELRPSNFVKRTPEQVLEMRLEGLREYGMMKQRMLVVTGVAIAVGCAVTAVINGIDNRDGHEAITAFASGGALGLVYLWMLTRNVDALGGDVVSKTDGDGDGQQGLRMLATLGNVLLRGASCGPVRLALLATAGATGARALGLEDATATVAGYTAQAPHYGDALCAVLGFFSYKAGVLVAGFSGTDVMHQETQTPAYSRAEDRTLDGRAAGERW